MTDLEKLVMCAAISVAVHAAFARSLEFLPPQPVATAPQRIEVRVVTPPEPPKLEPEPPKPEPEKPEPKPVPKPIVHDTPRPSTAPPTPEPPKPSETPPSPNPTTSDEPEFGVSMESTSAAGNGPAMPVGHPGGSRQATGGGTPPPGPKTDASAPVPDYAVTTPPLPQGRCAGAYTDEARAAGIEGVVVLDLVVGEDGRVRDIDVTQKLGHGLDQAAIAALRACRFTPGETDGKRVAVKVHGFKIRFVLNEASP
jgi:TonB family protein